MRYAVIVSKGQVTVHQEFFASYDAAMSGMARIDAEYGRSHQIEFKDLQPAARNF